MSIKLRNNAGDASVTLVDGGGVGSPIETMDMRKLSSIVKSGGEIGGLRWDATKTYQLETLVTVNDTDFHSSLVHKQFFSLTDNNIGNDPLTDTVNWVEDNVVKHISEDITITVGTSGNFTTLQEALLYVSRFKMVDGRTLTIMINSGHVITTRIDLVNLTFDGMFIKSEDAIVNVDIGAQAPLFSFNNTKAPVIDFSIKYNVSPSAGSLVTASNSTVSIGSNLSFESNTSDEMFIGVRNSYYTFGASVTLNGGGATRKIITLSGSTLAMNDASMENALIAINGSDSSKINVANVSTSGITQHFVSVAGLSTANIASCPNANSGSEFLRMNTGAQAIIIGCGGKTANIATATLTAKGIIYNNS